MTNKRYNIYGIGAALVDTEIEVQDHDLEKLNIDKGVMTLVDESRQGELIEYLSDHLTASRRASGGSAANTIIASSYFGASTFYSCKVANDENGKFYLKDMQDAGVATHQHSELPAGITGKCLVLITPDAERSMNTFLGISESLSEQEVHFDAVAESEYVYIEGYLVTSPTGKAAAIALRQEAEKHQTKVALSLSDPAMVQFFKDGLQEMIGPQVDLLFCNEAEAMSFTDSDNLEQAAEALKLTAKSFAITLGAKGALLFDGANFTSIDSHPIKAIDSNGAGDMFAGAFLYGITNGYSFQQSGELASKAAATVVSQFGPRLAADLHTQLHTEILG